MVPQVRLRLRCPAEKEASSVRSEVAPGRSLHQDEWDSALLVAGRGPERSGHRYLGAAAPGPLGSFAFLSQVTPCGRESTARHHHQQATELCCSTELILPDVEHRQSRYLNNRAENSHQPTRMRERQMKRFQSPEHAQRFLCVFESINAPFRLRRHLLSAACHRRLLKQAFHLWNKTAIAALFP